MATRTGMLLVDGVDGELKLVVAGDGATGITVQARYADDDRPLDHMVRLVVTATGEGGRSLGPLQIEPSGEGQGFYTTGPVLTPGRWQVTVTGPAANPGSATAEVEARPAASPPPAPAVDSRQAAVENGSGLLRTVGLAVIVLVVLAVAGILLTARRRGHTPATTDTAATTDTDTRTTDRAATTPGATPGTTATATATSTGTGTGTGERTSPHATHPDTAE
ncbi:hypothetical protein ACN28G_22085 [Micromonospora sp. WMMA1923]|uniref:hypothetical protein n=1 Tax=Micromonospora sp. WMMA1923 TaxID=3404125 RepID=UPI003B946278